MNNDKQWSSANPGLLVILLDQSGSMMSNYEGNDSKTVFASKAVNKVIDNWKSAVCVTPEAQCR